MEVHDTASVKEEFDNLVEEIAAYPEIKEPLQRESGQIVEEKFYISVYYKFKTMKV